MLFAKVKSTHTRRILCRVSGLVLKIFDLTDQDLFVWIPLPTSDWSILLGEVAIMLAAKIVTYQENAVKNLSNETEGTFKFVCYQ